jgi:hypothetical protein
MNWLVKSSGKEKKKDSHEIIKSYIMTDLLLRGIAYGTGGILVGSLYSLINQLSAVKISTLSIPCSDIQFNSDLMDLLLILDSDFMRLDRVAYFRAITAMDQILHLRFLIEEDKSLTTIEHRVDAFIHFRKAKISIQRFLTVAEETDNAKNVVHIQGILQRIMKCLEDEMHFILVMTRDLH